MQLILAEAIGGAPAVRTAAELAETDGRILELQATRSVAPCPGGSL
jgi:hypothetical protein